MIDNFDPMNQDTHTETTWTPMPFAPSVPDFDYGGKRKKRKKGKKRRKAGKDKHLRAQTERDRLMWQNGYLTMQNELLYSMMVLAVAADRHGVDTQTLESGIALLGRGGRK